MPRTTRKSRKPAKHVSRPPRRNSEAPTVVYAAGIIAADNYMLRAHDDPTRTLACSGRRRAGAARLAGARDRLERDHARIRGRRLARLRRRAAGLSRALPVPRYGVACAAS